MSTQANALFVVYTEATLGVRCDKIGSTRVKDEVVKNVVAGGMSSFHSDPFRNNPAVPDLYQGEVALVHFDGP